MNENVNRAMLVTGALGAGMLTMYLLDSRQGAQRRAMLGAMGSEWADSAKLRLRDAGYRTQIASRDAADQVSEHSRSAAGALALAPVAAVGFLSRHLGLLGAVVGGAVLLGVLGKKVRAQAEEVGDSVHIEKDLFINAAPEKVFQYWRNPENLPKFMRHVKEVSRTSDGLWHWKVSAPLGAKVEWDSRITEEEANRLLAWQSVADADVDNRGRIEFSPQGEGTRLRVRMDYSPPGGKWGEAVARLFGKDAKTEMDEDLSKLKATLEGSGALPASTHTSASSSVSAPQAGPIH